MQPLPGSGSTCGSEFSLRVDASRPGSLTNAAPPEPSSPVRALPQPGASGGACSQMRGGQSRRAVARQQPVAGSGVRRSLPDRTRMTTDIVPVPLGRERRDQFALQPGNLRWRNDNHRELQVRADEVDRRLTGCDPMSATDCASERALVNAGAPADEGRQPRWNESASVNFGSRRSR